MKLGRNIFCLALLLLIFSTFMTFSGVFAENQVKITILGTSDLHGRLYPYDYAVDSQDPKAGLAKISTVVKEVKTENPNTILVDAGDTIQDNMAELFNNERVHPMIQAMNEIGYNTWTLGNHEFNFGMDVVNRAIKGSRAAVLGGNIYRSNGKRFVKAYQVISVAGVKVGIIGMTTPHIPRWEASTPDNFKGLVFKDPVVETQKAIAELKGKADVIIGVMHMGEDPEYNDESSGLKAVANANPELAAIVAGHAHADIAGDKINGVLIVEPKVNGNKVSRIDLTLGKENGKWVIKEKNSQNIDIVNYQPDPAIINKFKPYHDRALTEINMVIGKLSGDFLPEREVLPGIPTAMIQDTALVDFINEVQMYYTKADISSAALFSTSSNLVQDDFRKKDVANIYKYTNTLIALKVNGKQLRNYMEWSAQFYNQAKPGDLTVSFNPKIPGYNYDMFAGVQYTINVAAPVGKRIENLTFKGKPVTDDMTFTLAVNNYRFGNMVKDGYFNEADKIYDSYEALGDKGRIRDLIIDYVQKMGVIAPKLDNNWKITGIDVDSPLKSEVFNKVKSGDLNIPASADGRTPNIKSLNVYELCDNGSLDYKIIDVLNITDFHGSLAAAGKNVGIASLVNEVKKMRAINKNTLFVAGGDLFQGSAESNLLYGKPVAACLKEAGLLASAIGNHEFDWGVNRILGWAADGGFEFLAANIYDRNTNQPVSYAKPYKIVEVAGVKIAFIGLTTPETAFKTLPENVKDLEFKDPVIILDQYTKEVREKGADIVIALTHLGAEVDKSGAVTGELAALGNVQGLDGIFAGHSHLALSGKIGYIPFVMAYYNGRTIGKLTFIFKNEIKQPLYTTATLDNLYTRTNTLHEDENTKAIYKKYLAQVAPILNEKIGTATVDINHDTKSPSLMGEWVCDIMRQKTGAQIAIQNGGGLRTSISKGDLTVGTMYGLMPFDNTMVVARLTGAQVREAIENGLGNEKISFGQLSGVYVSYDLSKPFGQRILDVVMENGAPLDPNQYYTVVANDFMFSGGDNYTVLKQGKEIKDTGIPVRDSIIEYVKKLKVIKPVYKGYQSSGKLALKDAA